MSPIGKWLLTNCDNELCIDKEVMFHSPLEFSYLEMLSLAEKIGVYPYRYSNGEP